MSRSGNRVVKQKTEKAKKYQRENASAAKFGLSNPEEYRKEMVHKKDRPTKAEREADAADTGARIKSNVEKAPKPKGTYKPVTSEASDVEREATATGVGSISKGAKRKAKQSAAETALGTGFATVSASGSITPLRPASGRKEVTIKGEKTTIRTGESGPLEHATAERDIVSKDYKAARDKRYAAQDEKKAAIAADQLTPAQKKTRQKKTLARFSEEKLRKANQPVGKLPESDAPSMRIPEGKIVPGTGKAGILNPGAVARSAGDISTGKRRKLERKAAYNAKKRDQSAGYAGAAKMGERTAVVVNARRAETSAKTDARARKKAASMDSKKDALQKSVLNRAKKMPKGTPEEKATYKSTVDSALSIIRKPTIIAKPASTSVVTDKEGKQRKVTSGEVTLRRGPKKTVTTPDEKNITKSYTREVPVGAPRAVELTSSMKEPIQVNRSGEFSAQPTRPKETAVGMLGSHEDRMHALTKFMKVPVEGGDDHDLEPVHLKSYLKHKSESRGIKYNERDAVAALFHARHSAPDTFDRVHQEALKHRTKRIGQVTEQRENAAAKAKEKRAMEKESRGGGRRAPRSAQIVSNVQNRFTEVNNDGGSKA